MAAVLLLGRRMGSDESSFPPVGGRSEGFADWDEWMICKFKREWA